MKIVFFWQRMHVTTRKISCLSRALGVLSARPRVRLLSSIAISIGITCRSGSVRLRRVTWAPVITPALIDDNDVTRRLTWQVRRAAGRAGAAPS